MTALSSIIGRMTAAPELPEPEAARRRAVVEVAAGLLYEEGPGALSLRRIATAAGGSTQLIYTLFGGKSGLVHALYLEGFTRLASYTRGAMESGPPAGDPEQLVAIGRAYLRFAREHTGFYGVMFGRAVPGFTPPPALRAHCRAMTFGLVVEAAQACLEAGTLVASSAEDLARICWVTGHGVASLEAAGLLGPDVHDVEERALRVPLIAHGPA